MRYPEPAPPRARGRRWRGFTLLELVVVIAIISIIVGAAVPISSKVLTYRARKATKQELQLLSDASAQLFRDTGRLPKKLEQVLVDPGGRFKGWSGPYLPGVVTDELTSLPGYLVDAWSQEYSSKISGDVLTITSKGEDGALGTRADLAIDLNVTPIRREQTLDRLEVINQAIQLYNGQYQTTAPLSTSYTALFNQLVTKGFLPNSSEYKEDAWGDAFTPVPAGVQPVVAVGSVNLSGEGGAGGSGKARKPKKG